MTNCTRARLIALSLVVCYANGQAPSLTPASLKSQGLTNASVIRAFYQGNFVAIDFDRDDTKFGILLHQYVKAFSAQCASALPTNAVQLMDQVCDAWHYPKNIYGARLGPDVCDHYHPVPTGIFVKPELYNAKRAIDLLKVADLGRTLSRTAETYAGPNSTRAMVQIIGDASTLSSDMGGLLRTNDCKSPALGRLEANLIQFALNKQPIRLDAESASFAPSAAAPKDANYQKLMTT